MTADYRARPAPLASQVRLFISGVNRSDDLFMFFRGSIAGLSPGARYDITIGLEIATDTPAGCFGVGGARARVSGSTRLRPPSNGSRYAKVPICGWTSSGRVWLRFDADSGFESRMALLHTGIGHLHAD